MRFRQYYWIRNVNYLISDLRNKWRLSRQNIETDSGTSHALMDVEHSVRYVTDVFDDYKRYGGISKFHGRIAEIGAGDNCGVAMLFLNDGCTSVDLPDRFYPKRDSQHQAQIYEKIWERYPMLPSILKDPESTSEESFHGIRRFHGSDASCENFFEIHQDYDFIVSRAVLALVSDLSQAIESMVGALKPEGKLIHKVDLRDHGLHSDYCHELKFLEVPTWLWTHMTKGSGRPNRQLIDVYRDKLESLGINCEFLITRLAGVGEINPHVPYADIPLRQRKESIEYIQKVRSRFSNEFSNVSDEDLSVAGFFLIANR